MATRERAVDRGTERGRQLVRQLGREHRLARRDRGLSLRVVASAAGVSPATVWRFEHALSPNISVLLIARLLAIVGLDLSAGAFPGARPLRDAPQAEVLERFRALLHASLRWATEVPFPIPGDQRAWDATINGPGWRYGVEAETGPTDAQALNRRLNLKQRDGGMDGVLLVLPGTRRVREFLAAAEPLLAPSFPIDGRRALELLHAGVDPGGSAIIVLPPASRPRFPVRNNGVRSGGRVLSGGRDLVR